MDIIEWLTAHDLIKIRRLCELAKLDPGNFHRWMNVTKKLPVHAIEKIVPILREYGYEPALQEQPMKIPEDKMLINKSVFKDAPGNYMGHPIPKGLTGIDLSIWKSEIKEKFK